MKRRIITFIVALLPGLIVTLSAGAQVADASPIPGADWSAVALALLDKGGTVGAMAALVLAVMMWGPRFRLPAVPMRIDGPIEAKLAGPVRVEAVLLQSRTDWNGVERRGREQDDDEMQTIEIRLPRGRAAHDPS